MRIIAIALLFSLATMGSEQRAKEAFLADQRVMDRINNAGSRFHAGEPQVLFLKESCGFLGCITDYQVGLPLRSQAPDVQSSSILARIQLIGESPSLIELLPEYKTAIRIE